MSFPALMRNGNVLVLGLLALLLSACAHSAGSYDALAPLPPGGSLIQYTNLHLEATNKNEVPMTSIDRDRLLNKIARKLQVANRYKEIGTATSGPGTLYATIEFTDYDSGNAFLRFLLAGLGQIHIDGILTLENPEKSTPLAKYEVNKTFAWGGFYGMGTKIEDVEEGFVEAVTEILLEKNKSN